MPATIDDPAILDEIGRALKAKGVGAKRLSRCTGIKTTGKFGRSFPTLAGEGTMWHWPSKEGKRSAMRHELRIRAMAPDEIAVAADWAAVEGWNPGLGDAACFATVDAEGFFIGELDGAAAATISCVNYDDRFAFLGFYIVRPDLRGRGYGLRVWNAAVEHAGDRIIALDGVVAQQDNYKKSGFTLAYRNIRFGGRAARAQRSARWSPTTVPRPKLCWRPCWRKPAAARSSSTFRASTATRSPWRSHWACRPCSRPRACTPARSHRCRCSVYSASPPSSWGSVTPAPTLAWARRLRP